MNRVDQAITAIQYTLKKRQVRVDGYNKRVDLTEQQRQYILEEMDLKQNINILIEEVKNDYNKTIGKLPPQDTKMEDAILGAIILESNAEISTSSGVKKMLDVAIPILNREHFYKESNAIVFDSIALLYREKKPIDMISIIHEIRRVGQINDIGGAVYIAELTSKVSSSSNIEYHIRCLIELSVKRQLILAAGRILDEAYRDESDCFDLLAVAEDEVKKMNSWIK